MLDQVDVERPDVASTRASTPPAPAPASIPARDASPAAYCTSASPSTPPARAPLAATRTERGTISGTSPYLLNSQVSTEHTRFFQHGIVAARIKPQRAKGMHSGFWMLPGRHDVRRRQPRRRHRDRRHGVLRRERPRHRDHRLAASTTTSPAGARSASATPSPRRAERAQARSATGGTSSTSSPSSGPPPSTSSASTGASTTARPTAVSQAQQYLVLSKLDLGLRARRARPPTSSTDTAQVDWVRVFDATSQKSARVTRGRTMAPPHFGVGTKRDTTDVFPVKALRPAHVAVVASRRDDWSS